MEDRSVLSVRKPTKQTSKLKPSSAGAVIDSSPPTITYSRRGRPTGTTNLRPPRKRISVATSSYPLLVNLKLKLRLSSLADTVHWLLHRIRPDLIPLGPSRKPDRGRSDPDSGPACMPLGSRAGVVASVRATVVQAASLFLNTPATLDKAERLVAIAAAYGSRLVVFPEAFVGGYPRCMSSNSANPAKQFETMVKYCSSAITVPGPEFERLQKIAANNRVYLVMGVVERCGDFLFSTVLFFDPLGRVLGRQRKLIPLPLEAGVWCSGGKSSLPLYQTLLGNLGGLISWDSNTMQRTVTFQELVYITIHELGSAGIEIYCAPTADARVKWKSTAIHIAVEGNCFVLSANQFTRRNDYLLPGEDGNGNEIVSSGGSFIASPLGTFLSGPDYEGECLISADLGNESNLLPLFPSFRPHYMISKTVTIPILADLKEIDHAKGQLIRVGDNHPSRVTKNACTQQVSSAADMVNNVQTSTTPMVINCDP
ncbi:Bifunctional nitrilase/nitrile hydratase NIT4 [Linum perenne]